jgi:hypothetical protein
MSVAGMKIIIFCLVAATPINCQDFGLTKCCPDSQVLDVSTRTCRESLSTSQQLDPEFLLRVGAEQNVPVKYLSGGNKLEKYIKFI